MHVTTTQVGARGVGKFVVDTFFLLVFIAVFVFFSLSPPPQTEQVNWLRRRPFHGAVPTTLVMFAVVTTYTPHDKLSCFIRPNVTAADFFFLYNVRFSPSLHLVILYILSLPLLFTTRTCNTRTHVFYTKKPKLSARNMITELEFKRPNEGLIFWADGKGKGFGKSINQPL